MSDTNNRVPGIIEGELVRNAVLTSQEMSDQNFARSEYDSLERLVRQFIVPVIGSDQHPAAKAIYRHLEQVRSFSGNFCWKHRHLGDSHDAKEVLA